MGGIGQLQDQTEKKITSENLDPNKHEDGSGFVSDNVDKTVALNWNPQFIVCIIDSIFKSDLFVYLL